MKIALFNAGSRRHPLIETLHDPALWAWLVVALLALLPAKAVIHAVLA
jgi:hypothetical protein